MRLLYSIQTLTLDFSLQKEEKKLVDIVSEAAEELGFPVFLIGGFVRDRIMGRQTKDIDIVCLGSGIQLAEKTAELLRPSPQVTTFKTFGTAMLKHKGLEIEFVGARKESYNRDSRKPSVEDGTLEDDQNRRDFTINALAIDISKTNFGQLVDPFGGIKDINLEVLRTPLDPEKTFSDDPLRMMRAIRFATQLGFVIEDDTWRGICKMKDRIDIVSMERVTDELNKIILADNPSRGFNLLYDCGLLDYIFPELCQLQGIEKRKGISHKDNFYHTLEVLDNVSLKSDNLWLRWAAILHDIAKPQTKRFADGIGWTFHGHEVLGAAMVKRIFKRMKLPLDTKMKYVQKLVRLHLRPISLSKEATTDSAIRRLIVDAGEDLDDLLLLCEADITSKNHERRQKYINNYKLIRQKIAEVEEKDALRNWKNPIDGDLVMKTFGIKPSKRIGEIKEAVKEAIMEGEIPNDFDQAYHYMLKVGEQYGLQKVLSLEDIRP